MVPRPRSLSAFLADLSGARFHPWLTVGLMLAVLVGSELGSRAMALRAKGCSLRSAFAVLLIGVSILILRDVLV